MDPAIVAFGFGIGLLVGMTGMGGASLMTPLLILIFGVQPVTAIGTDIFYAAVTKTFGGVQHLRAGTVHKGLAFWMAVGSVPAAIAGVGVIAYLQDVVGEDKLDGIIFGILGATLLVVGLATALRTVFIPDVIKERYALHLQRRHIIAAVATGVTTGFVIGLTSAGSGTLIAIILIAVFRLTPQRVVGTDIFHAAVLLWAAGSLTGSAATSTSASPGRSCSARSRASWSAASSPSGAARTCCAACSRWSWSPRGSH